MSSSRRSSTSSTGGPVSPRPPPELVLVNEVDSPNEELDFSSDDEMSDDFSARLDRLNASAIPPLSSTLVLLYLSVPYLKSGPMFLAFSDAPLSHTIPTLLVCALFAALTRQLWYLLARYLRKTDTEDVILEIFARGVGKERTRFLLRTIVRVGTSALRILLASVYLRGSLCVILRLIAQKTYSSQPQWMRSFPSFHHAFHPSLEGFSRVFWLFHYFHCMPHLPLPQSASYSPLWHPF